MVPPGFTTFFVVMAGVGATLFGLIFLVISIKPESTVWANTSVMSQVQAASAYTALLNPLVISLIALVPYEQIGKVTLVMSSIGLANTLVMSLSLLKGKFSWIEGLRKLIFILGSFVIYGFEISYAIHLLLSPTDLSTLSSLAILLVVIYLYGIARAWDLVGGRQFHIQELLLHSLQKQEASPSDTKHSDGVAGSNKDRE
jgi:hypothetical protein